MRFKHSPTALVIVRSQFEVSDRRDQQREITYVIRHNEMERTAVGPDGRTVMVHGFLERAIKYVCFDLTCQYGMSPSHAVSTALFLAMLFSIVYIFAQINPDPGGGIWVVWDEDRIKRDQGSKKPQQLTYGALSGRSRIDLIFIAIYFSILSATRIGWQGVNLGTWLTRMQWREYTLRATGWVRMVAGVQSIISVALVVLAILSYTGTPFE